ncbi:acyltransferase [Pedobacter antarcticus]|uniref:acyltransferase family protein n=1 Tax=Pedobacter antarcticus TaxID=34086 RepID=UPI00292FF0BE|nr:acyltransferase [Pedobacter antarcticus]
MIEKVTNKTNFEAIEVLRFPLMILVVFVHVIPVNLYSMQPYWRTNSAYVLVSELISRHLGQIAVPCFFLFSGYFFFLKIYTFDVQIYAAQIVKRLRTLLIPYLLLNIIFVLIVLLKNFVFGKLGMAQDELYFSIQRASFYEIFWGGPFLFPLWYLRDLICMMVLSPVFYFFLKYGKGLTLSLIIVGYLTTWELNITGLSSTAFLFFGTGAFMGIFKYDLTMLGARYKGCKFLISALFLGMVSYFTATPYYEYLIRFFIISGVISALCIGNMLLKTKKVKFYLSALSSSVFFIYAIHEMYIINWLKGGFAKLPMANNEWGKFIAYFTIPIVCLIVCLCLYRLMRRFLPNLLAILIGGRMIVKSVKINLHGV